jgi:hypothetical protein
MRASLRPANLDISRHPVYRKWGKVLGLIEVSR